jgi:hypothetical protein
MRLKRSSWCAVVVSAVAASTVLTGSARAVSTPGWRISNVVFRNNPVVPPLDGDLIADSAGDAWAIWEGGSFYVEHWTRGAWRNATMPNSLQPDMVIALGASSAGNVWLFQMFPSNVAVRYDGTRWRAQSLPSWVVDDVHAADASVDAAAVGSSSVWVFNTFDPFIPGSPQDHYASRYDGHRWIRMNLPGVPFSAKALAPNDIWVLGATTATAATRHPVWIAMHWNGKSWSAMAIPHPKTPVGATVTDESLVAAGARGVWLEQLITNSNRTLADYLLHWNGARWLRLSPPAAQEPLAQDGHGGIWTAAGGSRPHYFFYHYSAGHWTRYKAPIIASAATTTPEGVAWIPGTRSMWAWDEEQLNSDEPTSTVGVIFTYGP